MERIGVDICNTIADINAQLKLRGWPIKDDEYGCQGLTDEYFKTHLDVFANASPIVGARECLNWLNERYEIYYLSARPLEAWSVTQQWLSMHGFPAGTLKLNVKDKAAFAKHMRMKMCFEDCPEMILGYSRINIPTFIIEQGYNRQCSYGVRLNWITFYNQFVTAVPVESRIGMERFERTANEVATLGTTIIENESYRKAMLRA